MDWFYPPSDVHDCAAWERYWQDQASHAALDIHLLFDRITAANPWFIQILMRRGARSVLCAGNGVSQEPRALAARGWFEVIAIDRSPTAVDLAMTLPFGPKALDQFCTPEEHMPGGSARFVIGDILDRSVCPGPFDVIIEHRTLQLFPEQELGAALDSLASRLQPNGLFVSHFHANYAPPVHRIEQAFRDRGWFIVHPLPDEPVDSLDHIGRVVWLMKSTG